MPELARYALIVYSAISVEIRPSIAGIKDMTQYRLRDSGMALRRVEDRGSGQGAGAADVAGHHAIAPRSAGPTTKLRVIEELDTGRGKNFAHRHCRQVAIPTDLFLPHDYCTSVKR